MSKVHTIVIESQDGNKLVFNFAELISKDVKKTVTLMGGNGIYVFEVVQTENGIFELQHIETRLNNQSKESYRVVGISLKIGESSEDSNEFKFIIANDYENPIDFLPYLTGISDVTS